VSRREFVHHSAFGYCGGGPIELMEIVRLVPEWIEGRFSGARPGVHHVAWAVSPASVEDLRRELEDRGLPEYLSAQLGEIDITFHDASASLGHDIEIHVDSQGLRDFFQMVREGAVGTGRNHFVPPPPDSEIELAAGRGGDDDLVLGSRTGTALNHRNVATRDVEAAAKAAGLGKVTPKDLRASFCSLAGRRNVDPSRRRSSRVTRSPSGTSTTPARSASRSVTRRATGCSHSGSARSRTTTRPRQPIR
jgi:hypothetical protein